MECKFDNPPEKGSEKYESLLNYCNEIEIIIHVVNDDEYKAALLHMGPPSDECDNAVINFPVAPMVIGRFAKKNAALVQTDPEDECRENVKNAIKFFPNTHYILLVGACLATDQKYKLGDVLVSKKINNEPVKISLRNIFCSGDKSLDLLVSKSDRKSKVYHGNFASSSNERVIEGAIGCEMEGVFILKIVEDEKSIIIIKGVAYYADYKEDDWQFTAAKAAFSYTDSKLSIANLPDRKFII